MAPTDPYLLVCVFLPSILSPPPDTKESLQSDRKDAVGVRRLDYQDWVIKGTTVSTIWPSNPNTGHIPWENYNSKRYVHPNVHWSTIYYRQDMEAA